METILTGNKLILGDRVRYIVGKKRLIQGTVIMVNNSGTECLAVVWDGLLLDGENKVSVDLVDLDGTILSGPFVRLP